MTVAFVKDCCDREAIAHRGWAGGGLPGEPVREMLIEAVEKRFGAVEAVPECWLLEFLSDNGGAYIAQDTHAVARSLGLTPIHTPVRSPQNNGMTESFVNTFKRDYVTRIGPQRRAHRVAAVAGRLRALQQVAPAFQFENEIAARIQAAADRAPAPRSG